MRSQANCRCSIEKEHFSILFDKFCTALPIVHISSVFRRSCMEMVAEDAGEREELVEAAEGGDAFVVHSVKTA